MTILRTLLAAACVGLTATGMAVGVGRNPVDPAQTVPLQADGSALLHPRESIRLKLEIRDGKLHVKAVAYDAEEQGTVTFSLRRSGGDRTSLGVLSPIKDVLEVTSKMRPRGLLSFRCDYSFPDSPRPWTVLRMHGDKYFSRPVKEVKLSDFQFKPE